MDKSCYIPKRTSKPYAIVIHGGAGTILREFMTEQHRNSIMNDLETAIRAAYAILESPPSKSKSTEHDDAALNAVLKAVQILEDSPNFNAGKGSVMTHEETFEMDASIMHGKQMMAGAIAGVSCVKNPIVLAKDVMMKSHHVFLIGKGAENFALEQGHALMEQNYFYTKRRHEQLLSIQQQQQQNNDGKRNQHTKSDQVALSEAIYNYPDDCKYGTVGAVALDQEGNLAAATSSGGVTNKRFGRVGDSCIIGAGTLAENGNVAISTTGKGEFFIRKMVASDVAARMRYLKEDIHTACETVIQNDLKHIGGEGGLIAIDSNGDIHCAMNSSGMYRAYIDIEGNLSIKIYSDE